MKGDPYNEMRWGARLSRIEWVGSIDLSRATGTSRSTASNTLTLMHHHGLVERRRNPWNRNEFQYRVKSRWRGRP